MHWAWLGTRAVVRFIQCACGCTVVYDRILVTQSLSILQVFQFLSPTSLSGRPAANAADERICCRRPHARSPIPGSAARRMVSRSLILKNAFGALCSSAEDLPSADLADRPVSSACSSKTHPATIWASLPEPSLRRLAGDPLLVLLAVLPLDRFLDTTAYSATLLLKRETNEQISRVASDRVLANGSRRLPLTVITYPEPGCRRSSGYP